MENIRDLHRSGNDLYNTAGNKVGWVDSSGMGREMYTDNPIGLDYYEYSYDKNKVSNNTSCNYDTFDGNGTPTPEEFYGGGNFLTKPLKFFGVLSIIFGINTNRLSGIATGVIIAAILFFFSYLTKSLK
jgi:hypothetical protein